ncbi:MAG TPA: sugar transferase [Desulfohalobiaceae bacterium]|nr:sugar transferase [Desulfohalobiaceae bacterium]
MCNGETLSLGQALLKRSFDLVFSFLGLLLTLWIILPAFLIATIDTQENGFFVQKRVGYKGEVFSLIKLKTMRSSSKSETTVTTSADPRISKMGRFWRKTKIDELPQLINIFLGQMSFVGPRPDVPGFADVLTGEDRIVLEVKPGITGPATLKYRKEEEILSRQSDPEKYNKEEIFPDKVRINKEYVKNYSFWKDLKYIWQTVAC